MFLCFFSSLGGGQAAFTPQSLGFGGDNKSGKYGRYEVPFSPDSFFSFFFAKRCHDNPTDKQGAFQSQLLGPAAEGKLTKRI